MLVFVLVLIPGHNVNFRCCASIVRTTICTPLRKFRRDAHTRESTYSEVSGGRFIPPRPVSSDTVSALKRATRPQLCSLKLGRKGILPCASFVTPFGALPSTFLFWNTFFILRCTTATVHNVPMLWTTLVRLSLAAWTLCAPSVGISIRI